MFTDCELFNNEFGGISVYGADSSPELKRCRIHNNHCGIHTWGGGDGTFTDCESFNNEPGGISISDNGTSPVLKSCKFYGNDGENINVDDDASPQFIDCEPNGP